jgi:predicted thioredoxin/glutaredoxin
MNIIIAATKTCNHRPLLEKELHDEGLEYSVKYFDEHPELIEKFKIKKSPLLIVDDNLVSVGMPELSIIEDLKQRKTNSQ